MTGGAALFALFTTAGALAGALQAILLRRAVRAGAHPVGALARLGVVAGTLVAAALLGQIVAAAIGWVVGLGVASLVFVRRWS